LSAAVGAALSAAVGPPILAQAELSRAQLHLQKLSAEAKIKKLSAEALLHAMIASRLNLASIFQ
jgi:hypothetical protein